MTSHLMMYLAEGVAETGSKYRAGARHCMMIFVCTASIDTAADEAARAAERNGWAHIEIQRGKELDPDPSVIDDDILRDAAEGAIFSGSAIVVYADELPHNS